MCLKHFQVFVVFAIYVHYCTSTYHWRHRRLIHAGTRVYTLPGRFFPGRLPPTIIYTRLVAPYLPVAPLTPRAETIYPARGHNFPNPLENQNTFDLPQWNQEQPQWIPEQPQWNAEQPQWSSEQPQWNPTSQGNPTGPVFTSGGMNENHIVPNVPSDQVIVPMFPRGSNNHGDIVPVTVPVDPQSPVVVPSDVLPPVVVPTDPQPPVFIPPDAQPPVVIPADPQPPVLIPTDTGALPPVVVPSDVLPPVVVPRDVKKSCLETGCKLGSECMFQGRFICPSHIKDAPCQCQKGCRVQYTFIPLGGLAIVDPCGNVCKCNSLFGTANCTKNKCENTRKEELLLEPVPSGNSNTGPLRGDFPPGLSFSSQNFVPPIPFLTTNKFPTINGNQGINNNGLKTLANDNINDGQIQGSALQNDAMVFPLTG